MSREKVTRDIETKKEKSHGFVDQPTLQPGSNPDNDSLVRCFTDILDQKLEEFRAELFPEKRKDNRPNKTDSPKPTVLNEKKGKKAKKKKQKGGSAVPSQKEKTATTPQTVTSCKSLISPESEPTDVSTWAKVIGRKKKGKALSTKSASDVPTRPANTTWRNKESMTQDIPKTAAVTITLADNATINYAAAMAVAKQHIKLADCGISQIHHKKAITGGLVLEVFDPDCHKKADDLAARLRAILSDKGVRIARPVKTGELRVLDLDESITKQDIAAAISETGKCSQDEVKVGEIRFNNPKVMGTVWVRCPLAAVRILQEKKRVLIGWVSARVRILPAREMQCFRCLEPGHVQKQCQSTVDRSQCCYCCGVQGHKARDCKAPTPKCPVCSDLGQPADHRLGGNKCNPTKKKAWKSGTSGSNRGEKNGLPSNQVTGEAKIKQNSIS